MGVLLRAVRKTSSAAVACFVLILQMTPGNCDVPTRRSLAATMAFPSFRYPHAEIVECNVRDFGAVGDGVQYDTIALQSAISVCHKAGGVVVFPSGFTFLTGTLYLKSNVRLRVDPGAVVLGGTRREDYPHSRDRWFVILAENVTNVSITGGGEVNGQAGAFVVDEHPSQFKDKYIMKSWNEDPTVCNDTVQCRPRLIGIVNSTDVTIEGVNLTHPAYWCLLIYHSVRVAVRFLTIFGDPHIPNNDGIDVDGSQQITISNVNISTADDGVCIKTSRKWGPPVDTVVVRQSTIRSKSCAVKIGSESTRDIRNILVEDVTIRDSNRGLGLQIRDGANVRNISFRNVAMETRLFDPPSWWGRAEPIYITNTPRRDSVTVGDVRGITFTNVTAKSEAGIFIAGIPSKSPTLRELAFENVSIVVDKWTDWPGGQFDYRPGGYVVNHTVSLVYGEHATGVTFSDVDLAWGSNVQPYWGPGIQMFNRTVHNVVFTDTRFSEP